MRMRAIIVETFDTCEVVTILPWWAPDPPQDQLEVIARSYLADGDSNGDGQGTATARVVENIVMFPEAPLSPTQQAAMSGMP